MKKTADISERVELQNRIEQLLTKLKDFYAELSDRHPDFDRPLWIVERGFGNKDIDTILDVIEAIADVKKEAAFLLSGGSAEVKAALELLDDKKIDCLRETIGHDTPFYQVITFDHETRVERIIEECSMDWNFGDDTDRCVENASGLADEEFDKLVEQLDTESVVNEFGKLVAALTSLSQIIQSA